jgi:S1-C subfamily serine protease
MSDRPEEPELGWRVGKLGEETVNFGLAFLGLLRRWERGPLAAFADLLPFRHTFAAHSHQGDGWVAVVVREQPSSAVMLTGLLQDAPLLAAVERAHAAHPVPSFADLVNFVPADAMSFRAFTYVGPCRDGLMSWQHVGSVAEDWLKQLVLPRIEELNRTRVLAALPEAPSYDVPAVLRDVYVLENTAQAKQGTCFHLRDVGLVTCAHVLGTENVVLSSTHRRPEDVFAARVVLRDDRVDLAILEAPGLPLGPGLSRGSADGLRQPDHVALLGYPNHNVGDSCRFAPGQVVSFRALRGLRWLLLNTPIIAGNSGGPVIDGRSRVVGVAAAGVDCDDEAERTEKHGVIPIDALEVLRR